MSVAFLKEESAEAASETILPARPISGRVNLVTETGLRMLREQLAHARADLATANSLDDINERRRQSAVPLRDVYYYTERLRTALLSTPPPSKEFVAFGHTVTFMRNDGRTQSFRIVGEDEADPASGSISHASPVAGALVRKRVGDIVRAGKDELEIIGIV